MPPPQTVDWAGRLSVRLTSQRGLSDSSLAYQDGVSTESPRLQPGSARTAAEQARQLPMRLPGRDGGANGERRSGGAAAAELPAAGRHSPELMPPHVGAPALAEVHKSHPNLRTAAMEARPLTAANPGCTYRGSLVEPCASLPGARRSAFGEFREPYQEVWGLGGSSQAALMCLGGASFCRRAMLCVKRRLWWTKQRNECHADALRRTASPPGEISFDDEQSGRGCVSVRRR